MITSRESCFLRPFTGTPRWKNSGKETSSMPLRVIIRYHLISLPLLCSHLYLCSPVITREGRSWEKLAKNNSLLLVLEVVCSFSTFLIAVVELINLRPLFFQWHENEIRFTGFWIDRRRIATIELCHYASITVTRQWDSLHIHHSIQTPSFYKKDKILKKKAQLCVIHYLRKYFI